MSNSGAGNKNGGIFGESKAPQKFGEMGNKSEEKRNEQKKLLRGAMLAAESRP